jgi:hypothetical protein
MVGFIDRIRARRDARRNPFRPTPFADEQQANVQQLGGQANQAGGQYQDAYGALGDAKAGFDALAAGEGPSLAQAQLEAQSGKNIAAQMALAGQARGGNLNAVTQGAQATGAGMMLQTNQQLAEQRMAEQLAAMNASAGMAGQMAGMSSDRQLGMMGMGQQALGQQVSNDMAWKLAMLDDRRRQQEGNRAFGLNAAGLGLEVAGAAIPGGGAFSDRDLKTKVKRAKSPIAMLLLASPEDCEDEDEPMGEPSTARKLAARKALGKVEPYEYEYNAEGKARGMPGGKVVGVMAQDLERSEAGREVVEEKDGRKWLDGRKALSLVLAGAADHEQRLAELEGKRRAS